MIITEISGIAIPDSRLAHDAMQFVRDTESDFLPSTRRASISGAH